MRIKEGSAGVYLSAADLIAMFADNPNGQYTGSEIATIISGFNEQGRHKFTRMCYDYDPCRGKERR